MEAEISGKAGADKNEHSEARTGYRSGYEPRSLIRGWERCTCGPQVKDRRLYPFLHYRAQAQRALIHVIQEAFVKSFQRDAWKSWLRALVLKAYQRVA